MEDNRIYKNISKNLPYLEEAYELMLSINSVDQSRERKIIERNNGMVKKLHDIMIEDIFTCPFLQAKIEARSGSAYINEAWKIAETTTINDVDKSTEMSNCVKKGIANFINYIKAYYTIIQQSNSFDLKRDGKDFADYMSLTESYENESVMKRHLQEYGNKYYSQEYLGIDPYDSVGLIDDFMDDVRDYILLDNPDISTERLRSILIKYVKNNKVTPNKFKIDKEMSFLDFGVNVVGYNENTVKVIMQSIDPEYKVAKNDAVEASVNLDDVDIDWDDEEDE